MIRYAEHDGHENLGMSASRNLGVAVAAGTVVAFLDCDDVWLPSALAHRTRVAAAYPAADIVVGGTWRGTAGPVTTPPGCGPTACRCRCPRLQGAAAPSSFLRSRDRRQALARNLQPVAASRDALLAVGGLGEFRGLHEDQVLYVKAGLRMLRRIDPRPFALYRQHPESACEIAIADGGWSRRGPSPAADRFFEWMRSYVREATGPRSKESEIVEAYVDHNRTPPDQLDRGWRQRLRDATPESLRAAVRGFARRWRSLPSTQSRVFGDRRMERGTPSRDHRVARGQRARDRAL